MTGDYQPDGAAIVSEVKNISAVLSVNPIEISDCDFCCFPMFTSGMHVYG